MYRSVTDFLAGSRGEISQKPAFRKNYSELLDSMQVIKEANIVQESCRWGSSPEKKKWKEALLGLMNKISCMLSIYARIIGSNQLLAEVRFTPWQLGREHQVELPMIAGILYDRALTHLDKLDAYGITPELLKEFREAIDSYTESIAFPRLEKVKSAAATQRMARSFIDADNALEMIDLLVETVKYSDPEYWRMYRMSRRLVRKGKVKMALKAQATDKHDGKGVKGALFTFVLLEPERKTSVAGHTIRKKTMKQGGFYILHMPPGKYEITVTKPGYNEVKFQEFIDDKNLKRLNVEMEKTA